MDLLTVVFMYINLGLEHIATGYDHLLFLLALLLTAERIVTMVRIITAFTIAHSLTLCLAVFGLLPVYPEWVEAGIALTICYVAVENLFLASSKRRWLLTFVFGLIHGLGFANSIREIGFDRSHMVASLISFNAGIELGQLVIAAALLPVILRFRRYSLFLHGASVCIFCIGVYWAVQRLAGMF